MGSAFDNLRNIVFDAVKTAFAYPASWKSADSMFSFDGEVLLNQPSGEDELGNVVYNPDLFWMEYPDGDFPDLKRLVDESLTPEVVTIDGRCFQVMQVIATADGKQFRALINEIHDEQI